ncbi:MAG TPA: metallophosphoesterase [Smithellaceae bacterium]|nr:metallophosphoesterase [Smithellaceae bacterium]HRY37636.1 metallophosphoesterase [Smithellaceae bacterium]
MKKFKVLLAIVAMLALALTITITGCSSSDSDDHDNNTVSLTILQTSDIHDHAGGYGSAASYSPLITGNDTVHGGYARLAGYISEVRRSRGVNHVLLCDSGDFTMGTVYTMTLSEAPLSFMFFSLMQYDAITPGNHEYDLGPAALAGFINLAKTNPNAPFTTPILASNMTTDSIDPDDDGIETLISNGTIVKYRIIEKAGIKIGLLGIMGYGAEFDAPMASPLEFDHTYAALQTQVNALRAGGAKLVVLLSHEGFEANGDDAIGNDSAVTDPEKANDADIAKHVSGIDVILSGHLHLNYTAKKAPGSDTILVSPGEYGEHIARLDLRVDKSSGKVISYTSTNVVIDDTIASNGWTEYVDSIVSVGVNPALNAGLAPAFAGLGLTGVDSILDTVAINGAPITTDSITPGFPVGESVLGNLAADSYRNAINGIWASAYATAFENNGGDSTAALATANAYMTGATGDANRVQIAFVPGGVIRDPLAVSPLPNISFADLYNVLPLGGDPLDQSALGYPLLTTYLKAADIYTAVGISLQMGMLAVDSTYFINAAGIYVQITGPGTYLVYLCPPDGNSSSPNYGMNDNIPTGGPGAVLIDPVNYPNTLYKISVDLYTLMMMYKVHDLYPKYQINTYDALGALDDASDNRVKTGVIASPYGYTTMRGWQAIVGWSWAVSGGATSNLSAAGYTPILPYRRVQ